MKKARWTLSLSGFHRTATAWQSSSKTVRRQYQVDRANVADNHRVALLLMSDATAEQPARIGVTDVGGATLEDVTAWSTWQDPDARDAGQN